MAADIYEKLVHHLDNLPGGFPSTESGVELRIVRRLFTPDQAELALHLTLLPEEPRVIARRARISQEQAERRLEEMAGRGLVYSVRPERGPPRYQAAQYAIGIWEWQVNRLDPEFVRDMDAYFSTFFNPEEWKKGPQARTIPVRQSISAEIRVMPYEQAEALVAAHEKISVASCICRRERQIAGDGCDKPQEVCLSFGRGAEFYQRNGLGRAIDQNEALAILKQADRAGLVLQPSNSRNATFICSCCGCCCGILRNLKRHPQPATLVSTPFVAALDRAVCKGCGICVDRCQMDALRLQDGKVILDLDRCIGCGLCVTTCPTGALALARKPKSEQPRVPRTIAGAMIRLAQGRGKLGPVELIKMLVKSGVDRLLAPR